MKRLEAVDWNQVQASPWLIEVTTEEVRQVIDDLPDELDEITTVLDEAQGPVFTDEEDATYLVVKISK